MEELILSPLCNSRSCSSGLPPGPGVPGQACNQSSEGLDKNFRKLNPEKIVTLDSGVFPLEHKDLLGR